MLTKGHQEFIKSAVDYLFDFASDPKTLTQQIAWLKEALHEEVSEDHDFYALRKFLKDPQATLTGLEKYTDTGETVPSVGEVQEAILELAFIELNNILNACELVPLAAPPHKTSLHQLPLQTNAAYLFCNNQLFYVNQLNQACYPVNLSHQALAYIANQLTVNNNQAKRLSATDLSTITSLTGHIHAGAPQQFEAIKNEIKIQSQALISQDNFNIAFSTVKPATPNNTMWPWELMNNAGGVFNASLKIADNLNVIMLVYMEINGKAYQAQHIYTQIPANYPNINRFMLNLMEEALNFAAMIVSSQTLQLLLEQDLTSFYTLNSARDTPNIHLLLTNEYYLQLLFQKKINLCSLLRFDVNTINNLINPVSIQLQKDKLMSFDTVAKLNADQLKVISIYYHGIVEKKIPLSLFKTLSSEQAQILILPLINHLIRNKFLSFENACKIPVIAKTLLSSSLYSEYIAKHPIAWEAFINLKAHHLEFLLDPEIAALIKNNVFPLTEVENFLPELWIMLKRKNIYALLLANKLSLGQLSDLTLREVNFLDNNDFIVQQLLQDNIKIYSVNIENLTATYLHIFSKRLINFIEGDPLNKQDDFKSFMKDARAIEKHLQISLALFIENINEALINKIEAKAIEQQDITHADHKIVGELVALIKRLKRNKNLSSLDRLYHLIIFANEKTRANEFSKKRYMTRSVSYTFFGETGEPLESQCKMLCKNIANLQLYLAYQPRNPLESENKKTMALRR